MTIGGPVEAVYRWVERFSMIICCHRGLTLTNSCGVYVLSRNRVGGMLIFASRFADFDFIIVEDVSKSRDIVRDHIPMYWVVYVQRNF